MARETAAPEEPAPEEKLPRVQSNEANAIATAGDTSAESTKLTLPDIEQLTADMDFSVFMRRGVDAAIRRAALRRLWTLDPTLSELDGLVDYGEDFTRGQSTAAMVRTTYRVAKDVASFAGDTPAERKEEAAAGGSDDGSERDGTEVKGTAPDDEHPLPNDES